MNPDYDSTYLFTNDFPALLEEGPVPGIVKTNIINISVELHIEFYFITQTTAQDCNKAI